MKIISNLTKLSPFGGCLLLEHSVICDKFEFLTSRGSAATYLRCDGNITWVLLEI